MKKFILSILFLCPIRLSLWAQGSLVGQVNDKAGTLSEVSINVPGINKRTASTSNGKFSVLLPSGRHNISISLVGYKQLDTLIAIVDGVQTDLGNVVLESQTELKEVEIKGMYSSGEKKLSVCVVMLPPLWKCSAPTPSESYLISMRQKQCNVFLV